MDTLVSANESKAEPLEAILSVRDVKVVFSGFQAIKGVSLDVADREIVTIIGPNGAGKSTLLDAIGQIPVASGHVYYQGQDITNRSPHAIAHMGIGRKFQNPNVYNDLTVFENILLALKGSHSVFASIKSKLTSVKKAKIESVLERIGLLDKAFTKVSSLSHGQKQWIEIGMVLAQDPTVVLLDEPTAGMTPDETHDTGEIIKTLANHHAVVVIEHDMEFVKQIAQRIVVLHQGEKLTEGSVQEVQSNPKVIEVYLGRERIDAAANLTDVTVSYGQTPVLFNVDMAVEKGEIACILGRNGVGKTTLLRSVIGLNKVMSGSIVFDADEITKTPTYLRARYGISFIPQGREIIPYLSVLDNLKLGMTAAKDKPKKISEEIFEFFPMLKQHLKRQGGLLSGGQQQQLAIARGLLSNPKIMLLDEPTEGIQPSIVQEIEETLKRINREKGITVVVVEQKIDFARQLAQKFFIMEKGSVVAKGHTADLSDALVHKYLAV